MLLPLQGVNAVAIHNPGCRFACPGLGAPLGFQPVHLLNPELELPYLTPNGVTH